MQRPAVAALRSIPFLVCVALGSASVACTEPDPPAGQPPAKIDPPPPDTGVAADAGAEASDTNEPIDSGAPGTTTTGGEVAPPDPVDPVPALLEAAKDLKTPDADAIKALDEALAAGADKIELAKLANTRGEALVKKEKVERSEAFFTWAMDNHILYAEPVFNLAKQAALVGDADRCKELLIEVDKRGNKKLLKQVGIDPIFIIVQDDPEVRKLYEKLK